MVLYIFLWFMMVLFSLTDICNFKTANKKILATIMLLVCVFLGGLRDGVGTDWEQYAEFFKVNNTYNDFFGEEKIYETGYLWLNYLSKFLFGEYAVLLFAMSGIIWFLKVKLLFRVCAFPLIALMLNFSYYIGEIFPVRQGVAMAICVYSFIYIINKKKIEFILMVIVATLFHRTAIIFLPAYYIYNKKFSNKELVFILATSIAVGFSGVISDFITMFTGVDSVYVDKMITYYETADREYTSQIDQDSQIGISVIKKMGILIPLWFCKGAMQEKWKYYSGTFNLAYFSNVIYFLFVKTVPEVATRAVGYYNFFEIILLSSILAIVEGWKKRIILLFFLIAYGAIKYGYAIFLFIDHYIPYKSIIL